MRKTTYRNPSDWRWPVVGVAVLAIALILRIVAGI